MWNIHPEFMANLCSFRSRGVSNMLQVFCRRSLSNRLRVIDLFHLTMSGACKTNNPITKRGVISVIHHSEGL